MSSIRVCVILTTAVKMFLKPRYSYIKTTVRCPSQQHRHLMQHTADRAGYRYRKTLTVSCIRVIFLQTHIRIQIKLFDKILYLQKLQQLKSHSTLIV